ncbi:MAG: hypothetical protein K2N51_12790 [Lachnospiraceae bacterium]|nr:hypothetical protein [Lachnospiraceae bacterium]
MEILTILKANIKHKKGAFKSVIILMFIITVAMTAIISTNDLTYKALKKAITEIDTGDMIACVDDSSDMETIYNGLSNNKNVASFRADDVLYTNHYIINGEEIENENSYFIAKWNSNYKVFQDNLHGFIEDPEPLKKGEAYVPICFQNLYNCEIGSKIIIKTNAGDREFHVKGFVQEPLYGCFFIGVKQFFLSDTDYDLLLKRKENTTDRKQLIGLGKIFQIFQADNSNLSMTEWKKSLNDSSGIMDNALLAESKETMIDYTTIFPKIGSGILYAFVILLFVIVLVIICHSISTGIEMDYTNLGILKATGFSNHKIREIYILQYMTAQLLGIILGMMSSYPVTILLGKLYLPITGILIGYGISFYKIFLLLLTMIIIICIFVVILTAKVGRISPVRAISGGAEQIYFDSRLKMQINKRMLSLTLAFRQFITNKKHYVGTLMISSILVFFMMSISLLANCMSSERFMESIGKIPSDLEAQLYFNKDDIMTELDKIEKEIGKIAGITDFNALSMEYISLDGVNIHCDFYSNPLIIEKTLIKGRIPKYKNEISITQIVADEYGLNIGDTVTLSKENEADYLITGLHQSSNDLGLCIAMSYDAYKRIGNKIPHSLYIKLADSSLAKKVTDFLNETYPDKVEAVLADPDNTQMKLIETIFIGISALIYIISIIFALITVSMVCMRSFLRERIDIGIYKALGFTVRQLRLQFSFRFLTVSAIGSTLGVILCIFLCPSLMKILLGGLGVTNFATDYTLGVIVVPVCVICFCFFLFAYLVSGKIKKVEVRELISE